MYKINLRDVQEEAFTSPNGKYHSASLNVSIALGREPQSDSHSKRHPFDVELCRVKPGTSMCPYHFHSAQWEHYIVLEGLGKMRTPEGMLTMEPGDHLLFPPHVPHQIINDGTVDLRFYILADNPYGEACYYPDSDKWMVPGAGKRHLVKGEIVDYFVGEE
ncbi:MAG: cupin domain-containing protein [Verrucomicrobiota bacterium]|nr:cupin domain-containing protein [Verrucomicrobiota bacterium]